MVTIILKCHHCGSDKLVRDGRTPNGKQRYWCHACHRNGHRKGKSHALRMRYKLAVE